MISLRHALEHGRPPVVTTFVMIPRIEIVELVATAGFDGIILDLEHSSITVTDVPPLAAAARGSGIYVIARAPANEDWIVANLLDSGVDGVLVPHVNSSSDAQRLVAAGRFPGDGYRSLNPFVRGNHYGVGQDSGTEAANGRVALIAMAEGEAALNAFEDIAAVPGIDAIFVGPVDLSATLGYGGDTEHPKVVSMIKDLFAAAVHLGVTPAIYAHEPPAAARWIELGAGLVAISADAAIAYRGFRQVREELASLSPLAADSVPQPP